MPYLVGGAAVAAGLWLLARAARDAGEAIDEAGTGALKLAGAAAIGAGAWIVLRKVK